jgi:hypothetical protein
MEGGRKKLNTRMRHEHRQNYELLSVIGGKMEENCILFDKVMLSDQYCFN